MDQKPSDLDGGTKPLRLLRTKLFIPRAHPGLVTRSGLLNRLNEGLAHKLTLVIAPAGFGKSTLVGSWASTLAHPAAWVSLDERDNDPSRFWSYLIGALQTLRADVGEMAMAMLRIAQPPPIESILTELLNDALIFEDPTVLVLDDFHTIISEPILHGMVFFIDHLPPQMHLVIASRSEPLLPLPLLRGRRDLIELSLSNLRFSQTEAAAFFNHSMGLNLPITVVNRLVSLTEGWIAGLQLAALSIQDTGNASDILLSFSGSHKFVFDYLAEEVLNRQPIQVQRFLLQTAILERLCGPLCDAVLETPFYQETEESQGKLIGSVDQGKETRFNDSQSILEYLERSNLFILPLDQQRQWYRYHYLFTDFLRARLTQSLDDSQVIQLNHRASDWFAGIGLYTEATYHAIVAKVYELIGPLIMAALPEILSRNELYTFLKWIDALPSEIFKNFPEFNMSCAWLMLANSQLDKSRQFLSYVESSLGLSNEIASQTVELPPREKGVLAEILCLQGNLAFHAMNLEQTLDLSRRAVELLGDESINGLINSRKDLLPVAYFNMAMAEEFRGDLQAANALFAITLDLSQEVKNVNLTAFSLGHLAGIKSNQGQLFDATRLYQDAWQTANDIGVLPPPMAGISQSGLGGIFYEQNHLREAETTVLKGIEMGRIWANAEIVLPAYMTLGRIKLSQGLYPEAIEIVNELKLFFHQAQITWGSGMLDTYCVLVRARTGDLAQAKTWLTRPAAKNPIPLMAVNELILRLHILRTCDEDEQVLELAQSLLPTLEKDEQWGRFIEVLAVLSVSFYNLGDKTAAYQKLERALSLGKSRGYVRVFIDEGLQMRHLLVDFQRSLANKPELFTYIQDLLAANDNELKTEYVSNPPVEDRPKGGLSGRELEVLRLVAQGYSNQAIADELFVSLNTVKTHVKAIFAALEVNNRTQATSRARELGYLKE